DVIAYPFIVTLAVARVFDRHPLTTSVGTGFGATEFLRSTCTAAGIALESASGLILFAIEQKVKFDEQAVAVLVDEFLIMLPAAAMMTEQRERHGVEDARFAAAVESGQHPQGRVAVEADFLFVFVTQETLQSDSLRDHVYTSAMSASARAKMASRWASSKLVN